MTKADRGFAHMDPQKKKNIQSLGGKSSPGNFKNRTREELIEIARKGGRSSHGGGRKKKE